MLRAERAGAREEEGGVTYEAPEQPTPEEVQKVREFECSVNGHSYDEIEVVGTDGPVWVHCTGAARSGTWCTKKHRRTLRASPSEHSLR